MRALLRTRLLAGLAASLTLAACVSQTPNSTRTASTADVLFGDSVQQRLEQRRAYLASLNARLGSLEEHLIFSLGRLRRVQRELAAAETDADAAGADAREAEQELEEHQLRATRLLERVEDLSRQVEGAEEDLGELVRAEAEAEALEEENRVMERAITRTLERRTLELLEP